MDDNAKTITDAVTDSLDSYACDCHANTSTIHLATCNLWENWEFANGWAVWDHEKKRLVDIAEADVAEGAGSVYAASSVSTQTPKKGKGKKVTKGGGLVTTAHKGGLNKPSEIEVKKWEKCRHYQAPVTMPDGTVIYASSSTHDRKGAPIPDLGIYLDGCWKPDTIAYHVGCPDYSTPFPSPAQVVWVAQQGINMARKGRRVEVGCIGGHGRTGLMLAVMATIIDPDIENAVKYVQDNYCSHAVESKVQEWYVEGIKCEIKGEEWPEKPVITSYSSGSFNSVKYKYRTQSEMPNGLSERERNRAWSEHAEDCPCDGCEKVRELEGKPSARVTCSECEGQLFSEVAIKIGKHTWNCKKGLATTCPTCKRTEYVLAMDCLDVWHCNVLNADRCRCFRHHPEKLVDCQCERCK